MNFTFDYNRIDFPDTVYKFRKWSNDLHKRTITHQELYLAKPSSFKGDDYDCKLPIRFNKKTKQMLKDKLLEKSLREKPNFRGAEHHQFVQQEYNASPLHDKKQWGNILERFRSDYDEELGVLALTLDMSNKKMWNTFGSWGRGFCIGYDPSLMFPKNSISFGNVEYYKNGKFPHVSVIHSNFLERMNDVMTNLLSLRAKFKFQKEFRFMKMGLHSEANRTVIIPIKAHKNIVLGAKISQGHKTQILDAKRKHLPNVEVFQFEKHGKEFRCIQIE